MILLRKKSSNIDHQNIHRSIGSSDYLDFRTIGSLDYWTFRLLGLWTIGQTPSNIPPPPQEP